MRIIGAGFPRTGTLSTKVALEQLGFGPCYHFVTQFERPGDADVWTRAARNHRVDWRALLDGFGSCIDWPVSFFHEDLMEIYPDAKVLLTTRPGLSWHHSMLNTVYPVSQAGLRAPSTDVQHRAAQAIDARGWSGMFENRFEDRDFAIEVMERWNARVVDTVPAHRLLVFDVRQGWAPLCRFLDVTPPSTPFPHLNDTDSFIERFLSPR